jgi:glycogen(starch) synthase
LVYDAHEIYSSQEPDPPAIHLAVSTAIERRIAREADAVVTVSEPIAEDLERVLGLGSQPIVVLNCPPLADSPVFSAVETPLRVVYQGAMGPGRNALDILAAAATTANVHFSIRLAGASIDDLRREVRSRGLQARVDVLEPVPPTDLVEALAGFDVGLVINRPVTRNDELVLPNKLFEYLMAGLAIVAPRLPSLAALVEEEAVGALFEPGNPGSLGETLEALAARPEDVTGMRLRSRQAAVERYNAEAQRPALYAAWGL